MTTQKFAKTLLYLILLATTALAAQESQAAALPELIIGSSEAPNSIVEYFSAGNRETAKFHSLTLPNFQAEIDNGALKIILRDFPEDGPSTAASIITRCGRTPDQSVEALIQILKDQPRWLNADSPIAALAAGAIHDGITVEKIKSCLSDKNIASEIYAIRDQATQQAGVHSAPSFEINGISHHGPLSPTKLKAILNLSTGQ
jgi:protein-disulfide isomerase